MNEVTKRRLLEIKDRLESATSGTWSVEEDDDVWELYAGRVDTSKRIINGKEYELPQHGLKLIKAPKRNQDFAEYWPGRGDSELIVNAKADIDFLLSLIAESQP